VKTEIPDKVDFIGVGVPKSGSTWLGECFIEHPQICFPLKKELYFFRDRTSPLIDSFYSNGIEWYLKQFTGYVDGQVVGEFSPDYFRDANVCSRIQKSFPETKILFVLRNPVDMIYSYYWYRKTSVKWKVPEKFEYLLEAESKNNFDISLEFGEYYKYVKIYYENFPKKNILVCLYDDLQENPKLLLENIFGFLGVEKSFEPKVLHRTVNKGRVTSSEFLKNFGMFLLTTLMKFGLSSVSTKVIHSRLLYQVYRKINTVSGNYPQMTSEIRQKLKVHYRQDIEKLEILVDKDLGAWY
jgi:hypothetical protein